MEKRKHILLVEDDESILFGLKDILEGEDYTIGKILEFVLYDKYFGKEITFCGFRKPHPHIDTSILRVAFKTDIDNTEIITYLVTACSMNIEIYDKLAKNFARD